MIPYKTLLKSAASEFIIQKSRFIGYGAPCETEEEALAFLASIREKHKDATHNCYCYAIGPNMGIMRYSDDGEPGGTAGLPMIETVKKRGVTNACFVVTRYFGGILLGAGGLVRAYTRGVQEAFTACGVGIMHPSVQCAFDVPYPMFGKIERALESMPVCQVEKSFAESVTVSLWVRDTDADQLEHDLIALSEGRIEPIRLDETYLPWTDPADDQPT